MSVCLPKPTILYMHNYIIAMVTTMWVKSSLF